MKLGSNIVLTSYAMLNDLKNLAGKILVKQEHAFPTRLNGWWTKLEVACFKTLYRKRACGGGEKTSKLSVAILEINKKEDCWGVTNKTRMSIA